MDHIIIVFYALCIGASMSALSRLVLIDRKRKNALLRSAVHLIGGIAAITGLHLLNLYIKTNLSDVPEWLGATALLLGMFIGGLLMYKIQVFIFAMTFRELDVKTRLFFVGYVLVAIVSSAFSYALVNLFIIILVGYSFAYIIYYFWFNGEYLSNAYIKKLKKYSVIFSVSLFLVGADIIIFQVPFLDHLLPYGFMALPLMLILITVVVNSEVKNYLASNYDQKNKYEEILVEFKVTNREREVIKCLLEGKSYQETSDALHISLSTVKTHINNVYKKLNVTSKVELLNLLK